MTKETDASGGALIKITDLTTGLGLSSRSLRYYEQVGLIRSVRTDFDKYRSYDAENIERLKQIIVLRKMQIPIKDVVIQRIADNFENNGEYYDYAFPGGLFAAANEIYPPDPGFAACRNA